MSSSKVAAKGKAKAKAPPVPPPERNEAVCKKIAKEVAAGLEKYRHPDFPNPVDVPCYKLIVSPYNRGCQGLTLAVVWEICDQLEEEGADGDRPAIGVAIWFDSSSFKAAAIDWNMQRYGSSALYPPIEKDQVCGVTLSCSHLNTSFRCFRANMTSPSGRRLIVPDDDPTLKLWVHGTGHKFHLLREDTPADVQKIISEWKNQDQNTNQVRHEIQLIRSIQAVCFKEASVAHEASVSSIASKVNLSSPVKAGPNALCAMTRWLMKIGAAHKAVERVCGHHSLTVNPNKRTVTPAVFESVGQHLGEKWKEVSAAVTMLAYEGDETQAQVPPRPDISKTVTATEVKSLAEKMEGTVLTLVDTTLQTAVNTYTDKLTTVAKSAGGATGLLNVFYVAAARLLLGKKWGKDFKPKDMTAGKVTAEKMKLLEEKWVLWVDSNYPSDKFAESVGVKVPVGSADDAERLHLESGTVASVEGPFAPGELLIFTRRYTIPFPLPEDAAFRYDLVEGTEAFVTNKSTCMPDGRVMVKVYVNVKGQARTIDVDAMASNLKRPSACAALPVPDKAKAKAKEKAEKPTKDKNEAPAWTQEEETQPKAIVVKGWTKNQWPVESELQTAWAKGAASVMQQLVGQAAPEYDENDFLVVQRMTAVEVWTARQFSANKIVFAPVTFAVKDILMLFCFIILYSPLQLSCASLPCPP